MPQRKPSHVDHLNQFCLLMKKLSKILFVKNCKTHKESTVDIICLVENSQTIITSYLLGETLFLARRSLLLDQGYQKTKHFRIHERHLVKIETSQLGYQTASPNTSNVSISLNINPVLLFHLQKFHCCAPVAYIVCVTHRNNIRFLKIFFNNFQYRL